MSACQRPYYGWLPASRAVHDECIKCLLGRVTDRRSRRVAIQHEPAVESFRKVIKANPTMVELWISSRLPKKTRYMLIYRDRHHDNWIGP